MKTLIIFPLLLFYNLLFAQVEKNNPVLDTQSGNPVLGVGFSMSSFGLGPYAFYQYNKNIRFKAGANYIFYNYPLNKLLNDLDGRAKLRVGGIGAFADYCFYNYFYATAGVSTNFNKVDVNGRMANSIMIGDVEMTPEDIGIVGIKIEPSWAFSPYIGIGGGRLISNKHKFGYSLEIGTYFQGRPLVDLSATGMLEPTASKEQEELIGNNIKPLDFWPKIAINVTYRLR